jgi:hypothetical protein
MEAGCIGKFNTNNLPAPTNLTENPYGNFFLKMQLKNRPPWLGQKLQYRRSATTEADFRKMFLSSRKRGGADAQNTRWGCGDPYSR